MAEQPVERERTPVASIARSGVPFRSGPPAEPAGAPPPLPRELRAVLAGAIWEQVWVKPGSEVWQVKAPSLDRIGYVKILDDCAEAEGEAARLDWLQGRSPLLTPEVWAQCADEAGRGWLLTGEVAGTAAHDPSLLAPDAGPMVDALGRGLRLFHDSLDVGTCPFHHRVDDLLASAQARVARGGVDPSTLTSTYRRHTPERLLDHLTSSRPDEPTGDLVVAHGDPCQPNLLLTCTDPSGPRLGGAVDLGRAGVSDRHRDLAIAVRSLLMNLDAEVVPRFLDAYGMPNPDPLRLEWYVLADELW